MKLGIFSDIHGNGLAFEQLYRALEKEKCDAWIFLGDICGYYYDQKEIIDRFRNWNHLIAVLGNHDSLFLRSLDDPQTARHYSRHYGKSLEFLRDTITPEQVDFLKGLPEYAVLDEFEIFACHGAPWDLLNEYVYPDAALDKFGDLNSRVVLLGHTHHAMDLKQKGLRIINPGSSGQPRDGGWPSYALYETEKDRLEIKRISYDAGSLIAEIKRRDEHNPYLIDVLKRMEEF